MRIPLVVAAVFLLTACEPKFAQVTLEGAPMCPGSKLKSEVMLKIEGPRVSAMQRFNGTQPLSTVKLQQGKTYELKAYKCSAEPCDAPGNVAATQSIQAPEAESGTVTLELKAVSECEPITPPEPVAPPAPAATEDAGSAADGGL